MTPTEPSQNTAVTSQLIASGGGFRACAIASSAAELACITGMDTAQQAAHARAVLNQTAPGFPVLVPGQLFSTQILEFMRSLDTPEVHGYDPQAGYRVYTRKALEIAQDQRA